MEREPAKDRDDVVAVWLRGKLFHRPDALDGIRRMQRLLFPLFARLPEPELLQEPVAGIEKHHGRLFGTRERQHGVLCPNRRTVRRHARGCGHLDFHGHPEDPRQAVNHLSLADGQLKSPCGIAPGVGNVVDRMSGPVEPLVEEPVKILPGRFLNGALEVVGFDGLKPVRRRIEIDRAPKQRISQREPEHVEDSRTTRIDIRSVRALADDRLSSEGPVNIDARLLIAVQVVDELIAAAGCLKVQRVEVACKALIQPEMTPILAGDQVPPPLVRHLVRDQACGRFVETGPCIQDDALVQERRGTRILHAAVHEIGQLHLRVLGPGVRYADPLRKECHDCRGLRKAGPGIILLSGIDVVVQRDRSRLVMENGILPGGKHDQV